VKIIAFVKPKSSADKVKITSANSLIAWVREPAKNGKANQALISLLSDFLGVPKTLINIIHGQKSRKKIMEIENINSLPYEKNNQTALF